MIRDSHKIVYNIDITQSYKKERFTGNLFIFKPGRYQVMNIIK